MTCFPWHARRFVAFEIRRREIFCRKGKNNHHCLEPRVIVAPVRRTPTHNRRTIDARRRRLGSCTMCSVVSRARLCTVKTETPERNSLAKKTRDTRCSSRATIVSTVLCRRWWWLFSVGVMRAKTSRTLDRSPRDFPRQRSRRCGRHYTTDHRRIISSRPTTITRAADDPSSADTCFSRTAGMTGHARVSWESRR